MSDPELVDDGRPQDPLREQLLDAAARVFAAKGYSGPKVSDIVREAGLSAGAMYGRFESKRELLTEAVVTRAMRTVHAEGADQAQIADLIAQFAVRHQGPLSDEEALQLEAYVTARREPEVAAAVRKARRQRRDLIDPLVKQALSDGTVAKGGDIESILYFLDTVNLGMLLQRAAGVHPPDEERWSEFVRTVLRTLAAAPAGKPRTKRKS